MKIDVVEHGYGRTLIERRAPPSGTSPPTPRTRRDLLAAAAEARAAGIALELVFDARDRARRSGRSVAEAVRCAHRERH